MSTQARGLQNFISDLRNAKSKVSLFYFYFLRRCCCRWRFVVIGGRENITNLYVFFKTFELVAMYNSKLQIPPLPYASSTQKTYHWICHTRYHHHHRHRIVIINFVIPWLIIIITKFKIKILMICCRRKNKNVSIKN